MLDNFFACQVLNNLTPVMKLTTYSSTVLAHTAPHQYLAILWHLVHNYVQVEQNV